MCLPLARLLHKVNNPLIFFDTLRAQLEMLFVQKTEYKQVISMQLSNCQKRLIIDITMHRL